MGATPWMTTDDLVAAIQRKIAMPIYQNTFSKDDIIAFVNDEFMISQVPNILVLHEEYYVYEKKIQVLNNTPAYPIPDRAIGMRLRDIKYVDQSGNFFDMTQIPAEDKAYFQAAVADSLTVSKFYVQGNDIVLTPLIVSAPTGQIAMYFFIRPNQLVEDARAAIISTFVKTIQITDNSTIQDTQSTVVINGFTYTPVAIATGGLNTFVIGPDAATTAINLANAINGGSLPSTVVAVASTDTVTITSTNGILAWSINNAANCYTFTNTTMVNFTGTVPSNITSGILIDFLETAGGHRIYNYDILPVAVSTSSMIFNDTDLPGRLTTGDYVCQQYESIIPYLPSDLHSGLAERTCARILAAQGDAQGLQMVESKIADIDKQTLRILADRVDGAPLKINGRSSILRYQSMGSRRRI